MNYFHKQLIGCILSLLLIFFCCALLSFHHHKVLSDLQKLCIELPCDLSDRQNAEEAASSLAEKVKKAGASLAFFVNYSQLNDTYLCAAAIEDAAARGDEGEYLRASIALKEALSTLSRTLSFSFEALI